HPNIKKRRARTGEILSHQQGGNPYLVTTPQAFAQLRQLARFECIRQSLIYADYTRAFYDSYVLSRQLPDNQFLQRSMVQALYGIAMVRSYRHTSDVIGDYQQQEGEIQQVYYLFRQLNSEETTLLAMREIWKYHLHFPHDTLALDMGRDIMLTLRDQHHLGRNAFLDHYTPDANPDAVEKAQPETNQKYARIRQKQQQAEAENPTRFAFTDFLMQNGDFRQFMDDCLDAHPQAVANSGSPATLLYAPQYLVVENKTENPDIKYRKSDRMEKELIEQVHQAAQAAGLDVVDFSDPAMHAHDDAAFYNDFVTINEWTNEFWQSRGLVPLTLTSQPMMDDLNRRYGTDKLSLNTVVNSEYNAVHFSPILFLFSVAATPILPITLYSYFADRENTATRNLLIDTRRARVLSDLANNHTKADHTALVTNDIFNTYNRALSPKRVPGFLGRRLAVSAELGVGLPIFNHLFDRKGAMVDLHPALNLEWATRAQQSLALHLDYNRTTFWVDNGYHTVGWSGYGNDVDPLYNTSILSLAFTAREYGANTTAPLGPYFGWGLIGSRLTLTPQSPNVSVNYLDTTHYRLGLAFELGRNNLVNNKLLLNVGVRYHLTVANPFQSDTEIDYFATPQEIKDRYAKNSLRQINANLWITNLFVVYLGLGLLPF
ncbi:MAG: hypothetical protein K6F00_06050, partial [Lachnospiraceae bacterium]|nr:hypothetical protein [Lachnospiraceae bacterium]